MKENRNGIIITNGLIGDPAKTYNTIKDHFGFTGNDIVICADGGVSNAQIMGLPPDVVIGDMDSIRPEDRKRISKKNKNIEYISSSPEKDESDTQLAVDHALDLGVKKIIIAGATGNRIDHTLANIILLSSPKLENIDARIITDNSDLFVVRKPVTINGNPGKTVTLMSLSPYTYFIGTKGLKYELKEEKLVFSPVRGLSNEFISREAYLDIGEGILLVIREL